jgi:hypothetical protein
MIVLLEIQISSSDSATTKSSFFGTRESPWPAALGEMKRGTTDALGSGHVQL